MMIKNAKADSKIVVFEPGNCTRYYLVLTQTSQWNFVMVDMHNHKVVEFSAEWLDEIVIQIRLEDKGYGAGDSKPMAKYLAKAMKERAYIKYRTKGPLVEEITVWFEDTEEEWERNLVSIGEDGGKILERGTLDWSPFRETN